MKKQSGTIDNTSNLYLDYRLTFKFVTHASNRQAGTIRVYLVSQLDDSNYPNDCDGTESAETWTDSEERDAVCILATEVTVDNTASATYGAIVPSVAAVFGGNLPAKFVIFVTTDCATSTNAALAAAGSQVPIKGSYLTVAA